MPRSPFQGTFTPNVRPTVVTAPDAIVLINGEQQIIGCSQCTRSFDINKYITSISVDLGVDSAPGSASLSLSVPRHTIDDFYFDGQPVITPMMEVEIYSKGYYLVEGIPQYYPIFWGIITEVNDNYSGGQHTVSISCADILKWWEICKMNVNPAYTVTAGQFGRNRENNVFAQSNPYDIIFSLALQSFGDVMVATGSFNSLVKDSQQRGNFDRSLSDIMGYWTQRFSRMRNSLLLFGTSGVAVRGDTLYQEYSRQVPAGAVKNTAIASQAIRAGNGGSSGGQMGFDPADSSVAAYRFVSSQVGQQDLWQSSYQTKLEIANAAKEAIGFEFYMDVTGDIVFKPPFYNLDVLGNKPLSWIQDIDIIDWDFGESESEVVTQLQMEGSTFGTKDHGTSSDIAPMTSVTDYHLLRKYGWRQQTYNSEFMSNKVLMFQHGLDILDRMNSKRYRASVTIPHRPELRLGFPIYIAPKDQIWYVSGISHGIQFGSRATTTLTLTARRGKFIAPQGLGELQLKGPLNSPAPTNTDGGPTTFRYSSRQLSTGGNFTLDLRNAASLPPAADAFEASPGVDNPYEPLILRHPKTGRIVGYPNIVMAYTRPFVPEDINLQTGQKKKGSNPRVAKRNQSVYQERKDQNNLTALGRNTQNTEDTMVDKYLTNRYQYGLNSAGVFIYAHDRSKVISEVLTLPSKNVTLTPENPSVDSLRGKTAMIRPVSDERGFELIGHYRYGRRVALRDGKLVVTDPSNAQASVDLQLSLSGNLRAMLTAQSQGLTTIVTGVANPASELATLNPTDTQTAATYNPDTGEAEFVEGQDNTQAATYGSQEQQGAPASLEATQLSRALTLAEMTIHDANSTNDEDCVCLTGRQDLAFINTGYQVKTLSGQATEETGDLGDTLNLGESAIGSGATEAAEKVVQAAEDNLVDAETQLAALQQEAQQNPGNQAAQQAVLDQDRLVAARATSLAEAQSALGEIQRKFTPSSGSFAKSTTELVSKVDTFLTNLYRSLDPAHQQYERAIRGDLMARDTAETTFNGAQVNPPSEFAPPFSAPQRFNLGDVNATSGAIQTNAEGITEAWRSFGKNLRSNSEKKKLSTEISQDRASISRLTAAKTALEKQLESSDVVIGVDIQAQIAGFSARIDELEQNVSENELRLAAL